MLPSSRSACFLALRHLRAILPKLCRFVQTLISGTNSVSLELKLTLFLSDFSSSLLSFFFRPMSLFVALFLALVRALELSILPISTTQGRPRQADTPACTEHISVLRDFCLAPSVQKGEGFEDAQTCVCAGEILRRNGRFVEVAGKAR